MGISELLADLNRAAPLIGPSLLASDFANLQREVEALGEAGARILHLDVMDGHFVPNLSFGLPVVSAIRAVTDLPLDVHLMISDPARYVEAFRSAGADMLTIHIEAVPRPTELLQEIRGLGAAAGLALNPPTPVEAVEPYLDCCDLVLTMSVMPGFGGQPFDRRALEKIGRLREKVGPDVLLSVDGGVNDQTIVDCARAGAGLFIVGTSLLGAENYPSRLKELVALAKSPRNIRV